MLMKAVFHPGARTSLSCSSGPRATALTKVCMIGVTPRLGVSGDGNHGIANLCFKNWNGGLHNVEETNFWHELGNSSEGSDRETCVWGNGASETKVATFLTAPH